MKYTKKYYLKVRYKPNENGNYNFEDNVPLIINGLKFKNIVFGESIQTKNKIKTANVCAEYEN